jgi:adenine-specific DNA-methyltransferase
MYGATVRSTQVSQVDRGAVYTPVALADWMAEELATITRHRRGRILDPACGDGALLRSVRKRFGSSYQLVGIDIDPVAVETCKRRLGPRCEIRTEDTLGISNLNLGHIDAVIANPPWGAGIDQTRAQLHSAGFTLASGQYDTWDLFLEWCVRRLDQGTPVVLVLPEALFLPEHARARQLLLERTQLRRVARLGEGFFPGVFRGAVVISFVTGAPLDAVPVKCLRLTSDQRRAVIAGTSSLATIAKSSTYLSDARNWSVLGSSFMPSSHRAPSSSAHKIAAMGSNWMSWVTVGRGVEIGKRGRTLKCRACGTNRPEPHSTLSRKCSSCGQGADGADIDLIIASQPPYDSEHTWAPLIVGEDVRRYKCTPSRYLRLNVPGISYKNAEVYLQRKLLIRKTGLGLHAALDISGSYTTQVVFHFIAKSGSPSWYLDYLQGVICSRTLLAWHICGSGESEWRSHPYVTPTVLSRLPIPKPESGTKEWRQARAIAEASASARRCALTSHYLADLEVERLVAGLYRLGPKDCSWVADTLRETQDLAAFAPLRLSDPSLISPVMAA